MPRAVFRTSYSRKRTLIIKQYGSIFLFLSSSVLLLLFAGYKDDSDRKAEARAASEVFSRQSMLNISFSLDVSRKGVSLVSACQDKHEALRSTIPSWVAVSSVNEIILVDWSSTPAHRFVVEEIDSLRMRHPPVYVIEVRNQSNWEASRAFNVGFRAAHFSRVLKVDCDHKVRADFIANHALPKAAFYAGSRHLERASFDENLRGTLFIERKHFFRCGGYDERIIEYGGQQEDLLARLGNRKLKRIDIDYNTLMQTLHEGKYEESKRRIANVSNEIEAEVNLRLLTKLPPWNSHVGWKSFSESMDTWSRGNDTTESHAHNNVQYRIIRTKEEITSIRQKSNSTDIQRVRKSVVSDMLWSEFELPDGITSALPLGCSTRLLERLETEKGGSDISHRPKVLFAHCVDSVLHKMHCMASGLSYAEQSGVTPVVVWLKEANTSLSKLLTLTNSTFIYTDELVDGWDPLTYFADTGRNNNAKVIFKDLGTRGRNGTRFDEGSKGVKEHMYLRVRGALTSVTTRLTSEEAMRQQLTQLEIGQGLRGALQTLRDQGLDSAVGIYVRVGSGGDGRVREEMRELLGGIGNSGWAGRRVFYVDGDVKEKVREVIREFGEVVIAPQGGVECEREECEENVVLRVFAMKEVSRLFVVGGSEEEEEEEDAAFVSLVRIMRGEAFNW